MNVAYALRGAKRTQATQAVRVDQNVSRAIRRGLTLIERAHKKQIRRGGGRSKPVRDKWTWRSGELAKSFRSEMRSGALEGFYGSHAKYAHVIEVGTREALGGPITPKKKFLAIPVGKARYGVGGGLSPSSYKKGDLFPLMSKKGNLLLMDKKSGAPMFVLKRRVHIDGRHALDRAINLNRLDVQRLVANASEDAALASIGAGVPGKGFGNAQ